MDDQVTKLADKLQKDIIDVKKRLQHAEELLADGAITEEVLQKEDNDMKTNDSNTANQTQIPKKENSMEQPK